MKIVNDTNFGKLIFNARKQRNMTQTDFAKLIGLKRSTLARYEEQAKPPIEAIEKIAEVLDQTFYDFIKPEGVSTISLSKLEEDYIKSFKEVPEEVQAMMIETTTIIKEAWLYGKKNK